MRFELTILGSNAALPTSDSISSSQILRVNNRNYLIDCSEGTQKRLRENKISIASIDHIFISHLHGDHYYGIFGLISTFNLLGRRRKLTVFSHPVLKKQIELLFQNTTLTFDLEFINLNYSQETLLLEKKGLIVKSFPLKHRIETCGFLFYEKERKLNIRKNVVAKYELSVPDILKIKNGEDHKTAAGKLIKNELLTLKPYIPRSYAYCSDTAYHEAICDTVQNVNILYHEATFADEDQVLADKTLHSTASDAATIAKKSNAKQLIIGHFSERYKDKNKILGDAKKIFPNTISAKDHMKIIIPLEREP
ncbi:MAG: ribonuclease Z [Bacteroidota bacterium]|nr:ribonuclease Z [Bacteroidota bacterium]